MNHGEVYDSTELIYEEGVIQGGFVHDNHLIYSKSSGWMNDATDLYVVNLDTNELEYNSHFQLGKTDELFSTGITVQICDACNISGKEYWLALIGNSFIGLIPADEAKAQLPDSMPGQVVVEEDAEAVWIMDCYVIEDFVYYYADKDGKECLYRIQTDGTNWFQLY